MPAVSFWGALATAVPLGAAGEDSVPQTLGWTRTIIPIVSVK